MNILTSLDYTVIIGFLAIIMFVGLIMSRRASKSMEHYYLGGRNLPWFMLGVSGMSNWFDLTGTMIITSFLFLLGPTGLFIEFRGGAVLVLAFMLAYTGKWHRRSGCMTPAEWNTYRFGSDFSGEFLRLVSALIGVLCIIGMVIYMVRGATLFMSLLFPDFNPVALTLGLLAFASVFTILAGFYGVVLTDLVQGSVMIVGCIVISVFAWNAVTDAPTLAATAAEVTGNPNWYASSLQWKVENMPQVYVDKGYNYLFMFALLYMLRQCVNGMTTGAESRFFAARNSRECGLQCVVQGVMVMFRWPLMISFAVMGIFFVKDVMPPAENTQAAVLALREDFRASKTPALAVNVAAVPENGRETPDEAAFWGALKSGWHEHKAEIVRNAAHAPALVAQLRSALGDDWRKKLGVIGWDGRADAEMILPAVLAYKMSPGIKGFLIVALLAALMGALTGQINQGSALITRDIYQNFLRKKAGNRELILVAYVSTAAIVIIGIWLGRLVENINQIWSWIVMGLTAGSLGPGFLRLYWWRTNAWGMAAGMFVGGLAAVLQAALWPGMSEWWLFLMCGGLSFAFAIAVSCLTKGTDASVVRHFYRTTRPFGAWGRFKAELDAPTRLAWEKEHRNDILTVPFALLAQVTLFLLPMQLITKNTGALAATLPLFLAGAAGIYWFWWRNLPPKDETLLNSIAETKSAE
ncbi:MAG: hypothetical protein LBR12_05950 [Opitutaceae bacterium]|jgi:Na+/proline symporter|nr:hypothetical protein [Opitutaceae bacterium]